MKATSSRCRPPAGDITNLFGLATGAFLSKPSRFLDGIPDKLIDGDGLEREEGQA